MRLQEGRRDPVRARGSSSEREENRERGLDAVEERCSDR
jgi:hypothetical protein